MSFGRVAGTIRSAPAARASAWRIEAPAASAGGATTTTADTPPPRSAVTTRAITVRPSTGRISFGRPIR